MTAMSKQWREPKGYERAGYGKWRRPPSPYDTFMESQGVPIYRGIGVRRVQDLPLAPWMRMGGRGTFIQLYGTEGIWGCYLVEIPRAETLNPERHLYEEIIFVVEGRGAAEIWQEDGGRREILEWQPGSLFTIPLNTRRSPGFRRLEPHLAGNVFYHWIGQHETGRYSKAHAHESAAVLVCIAGKGYTYAWSRDIGTRPWETGQAEKVLRQDYEPVGMVSAAPMGGQHFHQHFGVGREPLRLMAWFGPFGRGTGREPGRPAEEVLDKNAMHLDEGGSAIPYWDEDPYIRQEYEAAIRREGVEFRMDNAFYQRPSSRAAPARSGPPQT